MTNEIIINGGKGGFSIWTGKSEISGHMWLPDETSDNEVGFKVIDYVTKTCKEHNMSITETFKQIKHNLELNNLIIK